MKGFSGRETQTLSRVYLWQGGFEQHYKIGAGRVESREKKNLEEWNFRSLAIVMTETVKI
jgi:hypothetical protein